MDRLIAATLDDKYQQTTGRVYLSAMQALVRLPLDQRARDIQSGLRTAGFISGYRGSPVGGYDREVWRAEAILKDRDIHFEPAINEETAATAIWGNGRLSPGNLSDRTVEQVNQSCLPRWGPTWRRS